MTQENKTNEGFEIDKHELDCLEMMINAARKKNEKIAKENAQNHAFQVCGNALYPQNNKYPFK